jgi:hypothetical protein
MRLGGRERVFAHPTAVRRYVPGDNHHHDHYRHDTPAWAEDQHHKSKSKPDIDDRDDPVSKMEPDPVAPRGLWPSSDRCGDRTHEGPSDYTRPPRPPQEPIADLLSPSKARVTDGGAASAAQSEVRSG